MSALRKSYRPPFTLNVQGEYSDGKGMEMKRCGCGPLF